MSYDSESTDGSITGDCAGFLSGTVSGDNVSWHDTSGGVFTGTVTSNGALISGTYRNSSGNSWSAWMSGRATQILVPPPPTASLTQAQKDALNQLASATNSKANAAGAVSAVCAALSITTNPIAVACAAAGGLLWATGAEVANQITKAALDPPDSDFRVIPVPVVRTVPGQPFAAGATYNAAQAAALNALLTNEEETIALLIAMQTAINRAQGATIARDADWEQRQIDAAQGFAAQISTRLAQEPTLSAAFADAMQAGGLNVTLTSSDVTTFEGKLKTTGLPTAVQQALAALGVDAAGQDAVRMITASQNPATVASLGGTGFQFLRASTVTTAQTSLATSLTAYSTLPNEQLRPHRILIPLNPRRIGVS
jgi:hypothetical protein